MNGDERFELRKKTHRTARRQFWGRHDRETYRCPACGATDSDTFEVHHQDGDWLNNHAYNLIAVCQPCHTQAHRIKNIRDRLSEWRAKVTELQEAP